MKCNTGVIGIRTPCGCLVRSSVCSWDLVDHQNKLSSCPELGGITQKIQLLKDPWAGPQSGLVRRLQNCICFITCWDKLKWTVVIELIGHRIKWQLQSGLKTSNFIDFLARRKEAISNKHWKRNAGFTDLLGKGIQRIFLNTPSSIQPGKILERHGAWFWACLHWFDTPRASQLVSMSPGTSKT